MSITKGNRSKNLLLSHKILDPGGIYFYKVELTITLDHMNADVQYNSICDNEQ